MSARVAPAITARDAYNKGRKCRAGDPQDGRVTFVGKFCSHGPWAPDCDLCAAWFHGFEDQVNPCRAAHARACPLGVSDPGNHHDCEGDWPR